MILLESRSMEITFLQMTFNECSLANSDYTTLYVSQVSRLGFIIGWDIRSFISFILMNI